MSRTMQLSAVVCTLALTAIPLRGQLRESVSRDRTTLELSLTKPFLENGDVGFGSSVLHARVSFPMDRGSLFIEGAAAYASARSSSSGALANPRIGITFGSPEATSGFLSATLPVAKDLGDDDMAAWLGFLSDPIHFETFTQDVWTLEGALTPRKVLDGGGAVGARLGVVAAGSTDEGDTEAFGRYGGFVEIPTGALLLGAEVSGLAIVTEGDLSIGERTFHQVTFTIGWERVASSPSAFVRLPLDDDIDGVDVVVGVRLAF